MHYSKIAQQLLPKVQDQKHERDILSLLKSHHMSLKDLKEELSKAQKLGSIELIEPLSKAVTAAEQWYKEFQELQMPDWMVKKMIISGHKEQDALKQKYDKVMAKKAEIKLKFEEGDTRVLNKIHKWN